jgi:hypothetical protein
MHYILDGQQVRRVNLREWAKWFETADRVVKKDTINGVVVSTVFLGLDHSPGQREARVKDTGADARRPHRCLTWGGRSDRQTNAAECPAPPDPATLPERVRRCNARPAARAVAAGARLGL